MKYIILLAVLSLSVSCKSNNNNDYQKEVAQLPSFDFILIDSTQTSSEKLPAGSPIILVYFNTDCAHCHDETKAVLQNMEALKKVQFVFLTAMPYPELKQFSDDYNLKGYSNIMVGRDYHYSFAKTFRPRMVPFVAIYNKNKELIRIYNGDGDIKKIIEAIQS